MVHDVEPLFPFDLVEATFLVPPPDTELLSPAGLITWRARQLQKRQKDLELIREHIFKARFESVKHFEAAFKNRIKDFDFRPGSLVLVCNTCVKKELNWKTKPRYLSAMVVLRWTTRGSYLLAELDGAVSRLRYAAFRLIPYYPQFSSSIHTADLTGMDDEDLDNMAGEAIDEPNEESLDSYEWE